MKIVLKPYFKCLEIFREKTHKDFGKPTILDNLKEWFRDNPECLESFSRGPHEATEVAMSELENNGAFYFRNFKKCYEIYVPTSSGKRKRIIPDECCEPAIKYALDKLLGEKNE